MDKTISRLKVYLLAIVSIFGVFIVTNNASASTGFLKENSIKTCPNGVTYGQHSKDNHWHVSVVDGKRHRADGSPIYSDPCPNAGIKTDNSKPANASNTNSARTSTPTNRTNTNSATKPSATPAPAPTVSHSTNQAPKATASPTPSISSAEVAQPQRGTTNSLPSGTSNNVSTQMNGDSGTNNSTENTQGVTIVTDPNEESATSATDVVNTVNSSDENDNENTTPVDSSKKESQECESRSEPIVEVVIIEFILALIACACFVIKKIVNKIARKRHNPISRKMELREKFRSYLLKFILPPVTLIQRVRNKQPKKGIIIWIISWAILVVCMACTPMTECHSKDSVNASGNISQTESEKSLDQSNPNETREIKTDMAAGADNSVGQSMNGSNSSQQTGNVDTSDTNSIGAPAEGDQPSNNVPNSSSSSNSAVVNKYTKNSGPDMSGITISEAANVQYNRKEYEPNWSVGSGCDIRARILQSTSTVNFSTSKNGCTVIYGSWNDPYTGKVLTGNPYRGDGTANDLDIDHVIPLKYVNSHGGSSWSAAKKREYGASLSGLQKGVYLAVSASENRKKSDYGPSSYYPPNQNYRCEYSRKWRDTARTFQISLSRADYDVIYSVLSSCNIR